MDEGIENLEAHNNQVNYILTHCCASSTQAILSGGFYKPDMLTDYLEGIKQKVKYKRWYFGHYHDDIAVTQTEHLMFENITRIA